MVRKTSSQSDSSAKSGHEAYQQWSPQDVANYFSGKGYKEYANLFVEQRLTGERVVILGPTDLLDMGIDRIGDRLGIQQELRAIKATARGVSRKQVITQHTEAFHGSVSEQWFRDNCCACFCPREPAKYILMTSILKISTYHIERCCGMGCGGCLGGTWKNDTIQLNRINDIDTIVQTKGQSIARDDKITILISASAGNDAGSEMARCVQHQLFLKKSEGEKFAKEIQHQVTEFKLSLEGKHDA